ncbi:MAG TPA: hypothetical protein VMT85_19420 [Thermoanaerobaculia bacterium]|nr:hypothetical protein [Thermoanaerobaculia bacterium]
MSRTWLWMATAIGMVIIAGGSVGVLADRMLHRDPEVEAPSRTGAIWFDCAEQPTPSGVVEERAREWRERRLADLQQELGLDAAQVEELGATMERHGALAREFWTSTRRDYCAMRDLLRDDVRELLDADQLPLFEERLQRIDERDRARYNSGAPREGEPRRSKQR